MLGILEDIISLATSSLDPVIMGLLDPVYAAGQSVIAGGGTVVGDTLGGLGMGVSNAGNGSHCLPNVLLLTLP